MKLPEILLTLSPASGEGPAHGLYPVRAGIPFPKGMADGRLRFALRDAEGAPAAFDIAPLATWNDGSWRWALLRFTAKAPEGASAPWTYRLSAPADPPAGTDSAGLPRLVLSEEGAGEAARLRVDTGAAVFVLSKASPWPLETVTVDGRTAARAPGGPAAGPAKASQGPATGADRAASRPESPGAFDFLDARGRPCRFRASEFRVEESGGASCTVLVSGAVEGPEGDICTLRSRLGFHAGTALVRAEFTLWNPRPAKHQGGLWDLGDPGSAYFRSLSLGISFPGEGSFRLNLDPASAEAVPCGPKASLRQESSGNPNWRSLAHVDRTGRVTPVYRGFRLRAGAGDGARDRVFAGDRANPALLRLREGGASALAMENFREAFPKAVKVEGDVARLEPFPPYADALPDAEPLAGAGAAGGAERAPSLDADGGAPAIGGAGDFELQGGEKASFAVWADFAADADAPHLALLAARNPVAVSLPPEWHRRCGALGPLPSPAAGADPFFAALEKGVVEGERSFFRRRDRFEEYGWRNFGEVAADHELLHFEGGREFVSHYNNQYDLVGSFLLRHASSGDARWFALGRDLARHVLHHDLYDTEGDKPAYNGGYFWHTAHYLHAGTATHRTYSRLAREGGPPAGFGGGPSNEHNYSTGLLLWHFLTGDPEAREAVLRLARWVKGMQDGNRTVFRFLSRNPTGLATCTRDPLYQGPGRGAAFSVNACLDAFLLSGSREWLAQAEDFIATCIHPDDDPSALDLLNREERWSYVVFLQVLGRYLDAKFELGETRDAAFRLARASLLAYAGWMAGHEYPYLDRPEQLEFPTSTWAGQELRKVNAFLYAARYAPPGEGRRYRDKADTFFAKAREYLAAAPDPDTVRNLALILGQEPLHRHCREAGDAWELGLPWETQDFPPKRTFTPQKAQAKKNLKAAAATLGMAGVVRFAAYALKKRD